MKLITFTIFSFLLSGAYKSPEINEARLPYRNLLKNPGAENGKAGVALSNTASLSISSTSASGKSSFSWSPTIIGETILFGIASTPNEVAGKSCLAKGIVKPNVNLAAGVLVARIKNGATAISSDVAIEPLLSTTWQEFSIYFTCPASGSIDLQFEASQAATFLIDNLWLGRNFETPDSKVNYIANFGSEKTTEGWATYANTVAAATPEDGTGGTANVTLTRTTTAAEILRGDASFELTVPANSQGEGFSYDFSVDKADQNKLLGIWFDVDATDANYVDDDLQVFIYDKDQSQLITPTSPTNGYKIKGNQYRHRVAFAPYDTSSNDYRLIIHVAADNASGYSVRFDNFEVGPGAIMTGFDGIWKTYYTSDIGSITHDTGTVTEQSAWFRPYKDTNGDWFLDYHFYVLITPSSAENYITIPGVEFANIEAAAAGVDGGDTLFTITQTSSGDVRIRFVSAENDVIANGTAKLTGKPTWADFDPIATIYPSTEDLALSGWESFSQTGSWNTNTTYTAFKRRVGSDLEIDGVVELSGAPNSAFLTLNLPSGLTIDTAKIGNPVSNEHQLGSVLVHDDGGANLYGSIRYSSTTSVAVSYLLTVSSVQEFRGVSQAAPVTFANNDKITYRFKVPIAEWADGGQVPPIGIQLASDTQYGLVKKSEVKMPSGMVAAFAGSSAPEGWLEADGRAVDRTIYADLFAAIGTTYGAGDGSTTFNLPDYRGQFLRGLDDVGTVAGARGVDSGRSLGTDQNDSTAVKGLAVQNDTHNHSINDPGHSHLTRSAGSSSSGSLNASVAQVGVKNIYTWNVSTVGSTTGITINNDTHNHALTGDSETRPKNVSVTYCIKI